MDKFGRVVSESPPDEFPARCGIAMAVCKMSPHIREEQISQLFEFFVQKSLGDRNEDVRKHMLTAAVSAVNDHGKVRKKYGGRYYNQNCYLASHDSLIPHLLTEES